MKLEFLYVPVRDLSAALALYRDALGLDEAWREGDTTVSLKLPGTEVQLMIDASGVDQGPGPMFVVDSVERFHTSRPRELGVRAEPSEIPGGFMATYEDGSGNPIYVLDQSTDAGGSTEGAGDGAAEASRAEAS
jgi:catechol 2,3-dioxygenase-like lactoylglutathione lyase family enzyme